MSTEKLLRQSCHHHAGAGEVPRIALRKCIMWYRIVSSLSRFPNCLSCLASGRRFRCYVCVHQPDLCALTDTFIMLRNTLNLIAKCNDNVYIHITFIYVDGPKMLE